MTFTATNRTVRQVSAKTPTDGAVKRERFRWAGGKVQLSDVELEAIAAVRARKRVA